MTVKEIVREWLGENGYDGLTSGECGCEASDLFPCMDACQSCMAGHKEPCDPKSCPVDGACDWHIVSGLRGREPKSIRDYVREIWKATCKGGKGGE